jgi:hypothetical protein
MWQFERDLPWPAAIRLPDASLPPPSRRIVHYAKCPFFNRHALHLRPDPSRVVVRPFRLASEPREFNPTDKARQPCRRKGASLTAEEAEAVLVAALANFDDHAFMLRLFERRAEDMEHVFAAHASFSLVQRQLIGAYFLHEYSFEAAALFNPSIVPHPDQSGVQSGAMRFILSLRAVGEGMSPR